MVCLLNKLEVRKMKHLDENFLVHLEEISKLKHELREKINENDFIAVAQIAEILQMLMIIVDYDGLINRLKKTG